jgi:hypothetical protein
VSLFLAAHNYQIKALKTSVSNWKYKNYWSLIMESTIQTVVHYLVLAHLYTAPQLLEASLKFLVSRKISTRPKWKELIQSYSDILFLASQRMIRPFPAFIT